MLQVHIYSHIYSLYCINVQLRAGMWLVDTWLPGLGYPLFTDDGGQEIYLLI